jgi:hypothetical protein
MVRPPLPPFGRGLPLDPEPDQPPGPPIIRFAILVLDDDDHVLGQLMVNGDARPELGWTIDLCHPDETEYRPYTVIDIRLAVWANPNVPDPRGPRPLLIVVKPRIDPE